ncbi:tRNA 5-methoxyuridine(34)/uridine 5-oxyacetic acid(34) synthase CmoB [Aliidiomarina haloalkalitolerans]|uniref:tRNA U34 carboxymethyltransferase n=1 Tax=Aliidiomarina haloalkalitolerans TaxID=859059 RepID=A0A432VPI9_9GAMM|nr:tRNA 5-methoxyuridine(34)/uridine 5-oxyacetic acid(34) synthase CmoB [Aliidiomarina haloalkalitolerans]RUO18033.1 tRNA 5-methoxyuridine(34)/uridine 5-oxyacetic acid(34) synthase CmoB [Aliidiomarina haloalkalitolerans]
MNKPSEYNNFYATLADSPLAHWLETLPAVLRQWQQQPHGEFHKWQRVIQQLPALTAQHIDLAQQVQIGLANEANAGEQARIKGLLKQLMPWRKGPFDLFGVHIDTEWRSDWKWDRVAPHISDLTGRTVLDIGCGSGYHLWRMLGAGADLAVGIDPGELFVSQFRAVRKFVPAEIAQRIELLPLGIEHMPKLQAFDTVFTMGVLYHRRSPIDFLQQCIDQLRKGGELILETLVVDGDHTTVLVPGDRYAQMPNVWFLPSSAALCHWLERLGMKNVRVVDECLTTTDEQRATEWMESHSLADFLDPNDASKTIEGYPAPKRAVFIAEK